MLFEQRELKEYAEPVTAESLRAGNVYFSVQFQDETMLVPILQPWVFIGQNFPDGEPDDCYFQDFASYAAGVRHTTPGETDAVFQAGAPDNLNHIFEYERALDILMLTSVKRRAAGV